MILKLILLKFFVSKGNSLLLFYYTAAGVRIEWRPLNVFTIVKITFSFPLGSLGSLWYL